MSLLRQIQDATVDPKYQLADILRMCKILAARLGNKAFKEWIEQELNGYKDQEKIPSYRVLENLQHFGDFISIYGQLWENLQIPLIAIAKENRKILEKRYLSRSVSHYEYSVIKTNQLSRDSVQIYWEADTVCQLSIYENMNCLRAWTLIPISAIVIVLDAIKTRILDFVIEIEAENPNAGDALPHEKLIPDQIVNNIYFKCILHENQMTENYTNTFQGAPIANFANTVKDNARQQANQHIHLSEEKRTLAEAANEIQQLIQLLEKTNPTATEAETIAYINDETKPSFKRRASSALQSIGETAIDEFILENKYLKVVKAAIKGWVKPV
ncbi:hypothetical protein H6F42_09120 [Pseudanabaena sp. FACHB-1998]|uniref:AbiTii domain-containing protein n=1 Tax=Pseudanabaena sp. FACHB-1998 TaxID=2692858 RepID=UPI0016814E75|nr:hypothetical protein [Pseudanabaena sp. FACHB-1998]MBD2177070.1 hypothetical protein [Pseudanabaena sp. FACHB-1998]